MLCHPQIQTCSGGIHLFPLFQYECDELNRFRFSLFNTELAKTFSMVTGHYLFFLRQPQITWWPIVRRWFHAKVLDWCTDRARARLSIAFVRPFVLENRLRSSRRQLSDNHSAFRKHTLFTYFTSPPKTADYRCCYNYWGMHEMNSLSGSNKCSGLRVRQPTPPPLNPPSIIRVRRFISLSSNGSSWILHCDSATLCTQRANVIRILILAWPKYRSLCLREGGQNRIPEHNRNI